MNTSICITVKNEEGSIGVLLDSLLAQTKKADAIIIVDGGSKDKTVEIINHYQKKDDRIKLLNERCSRARGRNLAVEMAKDGIIVMTDAGCTARPDWVKHITEPFESAGVDVVAGFYVMKAKNNFEKAESLFLGTKPVDFDAGFLPSTRSIAFTKQIWERVDGFPEKVRGAAEDTVFNYKLINAGVKFSRMKNAVVEWGMPGDIKEFFWKIFNYAKGDAKSKIWLFPGKSLTSHNIKAFLVLLRYLIGLFFLVFSFYHTSLLVLWILSLLVYLIWAYRKVYLAFGDKKVALWGPILQVAADVAVIRGLVEGLF